MRPPKRSEQLSPRCLDTVSTEWELIKSLISEVTSVVVDTTGLEEFWADIYPLLQDEQVAVVVICDREQKDLWLYVLEEVVDDLLWQPFVPTELLSRVRTRTVGSARQIVESRSRCGRLVSHDLNNPLTVIRMLGEMLKEEVDQDLRPDMESILEATDLASALVEGFASFCRLEGLEDEDFTWLNLNLTDVVREVTGRIAFRSRVTVDLPDEIRTVGDRNALLRAVNDILLNGLKLVRKGTRIVIRFEESDDGNRLVFFHPGKGVPAELRHRLLRRYGADELRRSRVPVAAVGLAYAAHVAEGHAGELRICDATDGFEVQFSIPVGFA